MLISTNLTDIKVGNKYKVKENSPDHRFGRYFECVVVSLETPVKNEYPGYVLVKITKQTNHHHKVGQKEYFTYLCFQRWFDNIS